VADGRRARVPRTEKIFHRWRCGCSRKTRGGYQPWPVAVVNILTWDWLGRPKPFGEPTGLMTGFQSQVVGPGRSRMHHVAVGAGGGAFAVGSCSLDTRQARGLWALWNPRKRGWRTATAGEAGEHRSSEGKGGRHKDKRNRGCYSNHLKIKRSNRRPKSTSNRESMREWIEVVKSLDRIKDSGKLNGNPEKIV